MTQAQPADFEVAIIGSGFAGLGMAIALERRGERDYVVLEQADEVGGTWRDNTYPGCACDVPSHLYSFSFAPWPHWSRTYAPQAEIQAYLVHCAKRYGVRPRIRFGSALTRARFDDAASCWRIETSRGDKLTARVLVSGTGGLSRPAYPDIPGKERFEGVSFHSQRWDHGYPLRGKRVAVVGTGASAIQFVPRIAPSVRSLHLYQRTPPWIVPRPDRAIPAIERRLYARLPTLQQLQRALIYWRIEGRAIGFAHEPRLLRLVEGLARRHIARQIRDPRLREAVTPAYAAGCKRILMADDYYPTLERDHVELVTTPIREISRDGVVTADGVERPVDAIIYGTGFRPTDPIPRGVFFGRGERDLVDAWPRGPEAYKGTVVAGFPNLFLLTGPNTGLGHSSMVLMIESQIRYVLGALDRMRAARLAWVDVRPEVQARYNDWLHRRLARTVWMKGGCQSWYVHPGSGRNTTLWPSFTWEFRRQTRRFDLADYRCGRAAAPAAAEEMSL